MKEAQTLLSLVAVISILFFSCKDDDDENQAIDSANCDFFCDYDSRAFQMGFTTWPFAPTEESVNETYRFISEQADIYSEHIDAEIPWDAWINNTALPQEFTDNIARRTARLIPNLKLTVSVSLLNLSRDELSPDYDGTIPNYTELNDAHIEDAYFKHLKYITEELNPDYLILAIEVNELLINAPDKWEAYKLLMANIKTRIKQEFPTLAISESFTLHNFFEANVVNPEAYKKEVSDYANTLDFVTISFYPFFSGLKTKADFQRAFDFLHQRITKKIAFGETGHLSEDLSVASFNLSISGNQSEQNDYLESLITNAQEQNYEYIIWFTHRDYNELWETFPADVKDIGKIWISTGIINEDGMEKNANSTWDFVFKK